MVRENRAHLVEELLHSPAGGAFLEYSALIGLTVEQLAEVGIALRLLFRSLSAVSIWQPDHAEAVSYYLGRAQAHRHRAIDLLSLAEIEWWFGPPNLESQIWALAMHPSLPDSLPIPDREDPEHDFEIQHPRWAVYTSTLIDGLSSSLVTQEALGDPLGIAGERPIYRAIVRPDLKIYTIGGPDDWLRLCERYPSRGLGGPEHTLITPDFRRVADDWDGVHVSFWGLLSSHQVARRGPLGTSAFWGWEYEATCWVRWSFDGFEDLGPLGGLPPSYLP